MFLVDPVAHAEAFTLLESWTELRRSDVLAFELEPAFDCGLPSFVQLAPAAETDSGASPVAEPPDPGR